MINSLRLENFKGFKCLELPDVATITLIGRQNNVGKTSLLEGIFLFYDLGNPGLFQRHLAWRGIDVVSIDAETMIAPAFRDFDLQKHLKIAVSDEIYHTVMKVTFNPASTQKSINVGLVEAGDAFAQVKTNLTAQTSYELNITYTTDGQESQNIRLVVSQQDPANLNIQFNPGPTKGFSELMRRGAIYLGL